MATVPCWKMVKDHRPAPRAAAPYFIKDELDRLERRAGVIQLSYLADITYARLMIMFGYSKKDRNISDVWPQLALIDNLLPLAYVASNIMPAPIKSGDRSCF